MRAVVMQRAAWSCFSHLGGTPDRLLYADALGDHYEYDSNVVNAKRLKAGDLLIVRDRHLIYGYGVIDSIEQQQATKVMRRCPACRSADIVSRKRARPEFRCGDCRHEFEVPLADPMEVTLYTASYTSAWLELPSPVPVRALERVYAGRDRQNAIRRLDMTETQALLGFHGGLEALFHLELLSHADSIAGGHLERLAKQRVGQQHFRERMLDRFGSTCAVTGEQPEAVLDAAHLYTYAERPVHEDDGGLLLRADVHRMFDRLLITFDPLTRQSQVAPPLLRRHGHLVSLDTRPIAIPEHLRPRLELIEEHHRAARQRWRDLDRLIKPR